MMQQNILHNKARYASEKMREHFGSGWRMYFVQRGQHLIVMLGDGGKPTQDRDIAKAIALSKKLED